jgi:arginase
MRRASIIGVPMDFGGNERGVDMGPSAIRLAGIADQLAAIGVDVRDLGNVLVHTRARTERGTETAHYLAEIMRTCDALAAMVEQALDADTTPLVLGGDHSIAIGTLRALARRFGAPGGAIWIDAHADVNTPATTVSGNVHGMALAIPLGLCADHELISNGNWPTQCVDPKHTVIIGARDLDPKEREYLLTDDAPRVITTAEIDRRGISQVAAEALEIVSGAPFVHVSVDLDSLDPDVAPGVGTPVRGGLAYREAHALLEAIAAANVMTTMDLVEVNPVLDVRNATAQIAADLSCSLFGKRILGKLPR